MGALTSRTRFGSAGVALVWLAGCAAAPPERGDTPAGSAALAAPSASASLQASVGEPAAERQQANGRAGRAAILRIDALPLPGAEQPVVTTVLDLMPRAPPGAGEACQALAGDAELRCVTAAALRPISGPPLSPASAALTMSIAGQDQSLLRARVRRWGDASQSHVPRVGTAWLVALDASSRMGRSFEDAKTFADTLLASARPEDLFDVAVFNDRVVVAHSGWSTDVATVRTFLSAQSKPFPSMSRVRPLSQLVTQVAVDGFVALAEKPAADVPLHQVLVVLSSGDGEAGPAGGAGASSLNAVLTRGQYPSTRAQPPRMPTPVLSIWFPQRALEEQFDAARTFMSAIANPDIGGFFAIATGGAATLAEQAVRAARARFDAMWLVEWQTPACINPSSTQSFNLTFEPASNIAGDASFRDVTLAAAPGCKPR